MRNTNKRYVALITALVMTFGSFMFVSVDAGQQSSVDVGSLAMIAPLTQSTTPASLTIADTHVGGTPPGTTSHQAGAVIPLGAGTRAGFVFYRWNVSPPGGGTFANASNASTNFTFTPTIAGQTITVTAIWNPVAPPATFALTVANTGTGGTPPGVSQRQAGAIIPLVAGTRDGYFFAGWTATSGSFADANSAQTTFAMPGQAVTVTVNWLPIRLGNFELNVANTGVGGTPIGFSHHQAGAVILLNAGTRAGYNFNGWTTSGGGTFANSSLVQTNFTMPNQAVTVTANWISVTAASFPLTIAGTGTGGTPVGLSQRQVGANVLLNAGTRQGYDFTGWTVTPVGQGTFANAALPETNFVMPGQAVTVTATWTRVPGTFTVIINNVPTELTGEIAGQSGEGHYLPGATVNLVAGSRPGYTFQGWATTTASGIVIQNLNAANTSFVMPANSVIVSAHWVSNQPSPSPTPPPGSFTLTLRASSGGRVSIDGGAYGTTRTAHFRPGDRITISARANRDYYFDIWDAPRANISDELREVTAFTMPSRNITVWAEFVHYTDWDSWRDRPGARPPSHPHSPFPPATAPAGPQLPRPTPVPTPTAPPPQQTPWLNHDYVPQHTAQQPGQPMPLPEPAPIPVTPQVTHLSVNVNGRPLSLTAGQPAVLVQGVSLIPVGQVFRALGYTVSWDNGTRTATMRRHNITIALQEGNDSFTVNGIRHNLPVAPMVVNDNLMVPVVDIINAIGGRAHRDINDTVHIYLTR